MLQKLIKILKDFKISGTYDATIAAQNECVASQIGYVAPLRLKIGMLRLCDPH